MSKWPNEKQRVELACAERMGRELAAVGLPFSISMKMLDEFSKSASKAGLRVLLVVVDERVLGLRVRDLRMMFNTRGVWNYRATFRRKQVELCLDEGGLHVEWSTGYVRLGVVCKPSNAREYEQWQERSLVLAMTRKVA